MARRLIGRVALSLSCSQYGLVHRARVWALVPRARWCNECIAAALCPSSRPLSRNQTLHLIVTSRQRSRL